MGDIKLIYPVLIIVQYGCTYDNRGILSVSKAAVVKHATSLFLFLGCSVYQTHNVSSELGAGSSISALHEKSVHFLSSKWIKTYQNKDYKSPSTQYGQLVT